MCAHVRSEAALKSSEAAATAGAAATALASQAATCHEVRPSSSTKHRFPPDGGTMEEICEPPSHALRPVTPSQALDAFLPETASDMCRLIEAHVVSGAAAGEEVGESHWFTAMQLMEIAGLCMVRAC